MQNPIFPAILQGDVAEVNRLATDPANLEARADLHDDHGAFYKSMTPLMVAAAAPGERAESVRVLLDAGADPNAHSAAGTPKRRPRATPKRSNEPKAPWKKPPSLSSPKCDLWAWNP
ncbi:hypothetical protein BH11ARM2_BH11ARM2_32800 [soil metagenome]